MANRFFLGSTTDPNLNEIYPIIVGGSDVPQRESLDNTQMIVMLNDGDTSDYPQLANFTELTQAQADELVMTSDWQPSEI